MNTINIVEQKIVNNDFVDNIYDMYFPYIENVLIKDNTINNEIKKNENKNIKKNNKYKSNNNNLRIRNNN